MKDSVIIVSGGMDSITLLYDKKDEIALGISFNYGSNHNEREIPFAKMHCERLGIKHITIDLGFMHQYFKSSLLEGADAIPEGHYAADNMKSTVVPFRNGIMLSIAIGIAESNNLKKVFIANHGGDHTIYPDCRPEFIKAIDEAAEAGTFVEKGTPEFDAAKAEMKERQKKFAAKLASYADVYVMDAFGTAHRKHASTAVIADSFDKDHKMLGFLMEKEVKAVDAVLGNIKRPFTAIMGGSKVSTKIGIIENLLTKVDNLILCGGMTYTFSKALGGKIGMSICEDDKLDVALDVIKKAKENGVNLVLGTDSICGDDFKNDCNTQVCPSNNIPDGWEGMDAGPETRKAFAAAIKGAKTILWNGPAGVFEFDNFAGGSKAIADAIAEATKEGAFSLIGGGDSVACINKFGLADQVSYISTGGGALLEAIEGKVLPGVAAIEK